MAEHSESFIKTPQQLVAVILASFIVPVVGIILLVKLVTGQPSADPAALKPEAVAARIQPVGRVEFGEPPAPPGARTGEEIAKAVCGACHVPGIANAPKIGDPASWANQLKMPLEALVKSAIQGKGAMPPRGGAPDLTDAEIARSIVFMANQSGGKFKEPAAAADKPKAPAAKGK